MPIAHSAHAAPARSCMQIGPGCISASPLCMGSQAPSTAPHAVPSPSHPYFCSLSLSLCLCFIQCFCCFHFAPYLNLVCPPNRTIRCDAMRCCPRSCLSLASHAFWPFLRFLLSVLSVLSLWLLLIFALSQRRSVQLHWTLALSTHSCRDADSHGIAS